MCIIGYIIFITGQVKKVNPNISLPVILDALDKKYVIKARLEEDKDGTVFAKYISKEKLDKENLIYFYTKEAMDVRELIIVKCDTDTSKLDTIEKDINARLSDEKSKFLSYGVGQYDLLTRSALIRKDPYILFIVDENADSIKDTFEEVIYSDIN